MTTAALNRIGKLWVSIIKQKIKRSKKIASGFLYDSISYKVVKDADGDPALEVTYADYFKYVNKGRVPRGTARPISAANGAVPIKPLLSWIKIKGLRGRDDNGRFIPDLSLAFAIRASIWKKGIKPFGKGSLIYDPALDKLEKMLNPEKIPAGTPPELVQELTRIYEAVAEDISIIINDMVRKEISDKK